MVAAVELRDLGTGVLYLGALAAALAAIGVVMRVAVVRPLLRWLAAELGKLLPLIADTRDAATALRDAITHTQTQVTTLTTRLDDHLRNHP